MVQVPQRTRIPNNSIYYDLGNVRIDLQPRDAAKKLQMKEMILELTSLLPKHNKLMEKDKNGQWVQIAEKKTDGKADPKADPKSTDPKLSARPGDSAR